MYLRWLSYFRNCPVCGKWKINSPICVSCRSEMIKLTSRQFNLHARMFAFSLYVWEQSTSHLIKPLAYAIKNGENKELISYLAQELSYKLAAAGKRDFDLIIPIPSTEPGKKDHAYLLAEGLSKNLSIPLVCAFSWKYKQSEQKWKKKKDRHNLEISLLCPTKDLRNRSILIVDDIITTGSTMIAAGQAIKSPKKIVGVSVSCKL